MASVHLRQRSSLLLVFLLTVLVVLLSNGADARAKNNMKLRIPYLQRANCLAKLLCGIQAQSNTQSGAAVYANQAHLLRKYFQTYELPELDDKPIKSKSSAADDDDDLDESTSSDESNESTVEEVVKKPTAAPVKKQEKPKAKESKPDRKSSLFDTGVPIIEKPTLSPAVAVQQQKGKRHWTPINQELTVRVARELASKSVKNCNAIEGCGFTFKQIFISLQEDSNVMGSEAVSALSSDNFEAPIAETPKEEEKDVKVQLLVKKATASPITHAVYTDDELEPQLGQVAPAPVGTSPYPPPPIIINENEDEVENEDIKIIDVEDLFLSTDHVLSSHDREPVRKKTRRPVTANTKKEKLRPTTVRPEVVAYEYQLTSSRSKGSKTRPPRLNYKTATAPKPQSKKSYPTTTTTERTTTTTAPSTQIPIFEAAKIKKKPAKRPTKHEFQQDEENYDQSRDTYDEEEELENPSANDYGDDLEDVSLEEDDDTDVVEDDEDDEALEQQQGGWNEGGGEKKKKPKPPKQKKKKNKKNKKKKNKKKKNKKKKKKGQQEHQGWGWPQPPKKQLLTEIGGRPLSPPPEPHPGHNIFSQSSGWATLYRREVPEQSASGTKETQQQQQPQALFPSFRFGTPSVAASNSTSSTFNSSSSAGARFEAEEEHQEYKYRPQQDQIPAEKVTGFSITRLVSPFTSLVKVINSNMRGR